jgi:cell division protein FtsW (lipid II flippase)
VAGVRPLPPGAGNSASGRQDDQVERTSGGLAGWWPWWRGSHGEALPLRRTAALLLGVAAASLAVTAWRRDLGMTLVALTTLLAPLHVAAAGGAYCVATAAATVALSAAGLRLGRPDGLPTNPGPTGSTTGGGAQALAGLARGGLAGSGQPRISRAARVDGQPGSGSAWPFAALGEVFGLAGVGAALGCYATLTVRGLRIAMLQRRAGRRLLAAAAAAALASQAAVSAAANLGLIPPTDVGAPFLAPFLAGTWLSGAANSLAAGVLLYISGAADWTGSIGFGPARGSTPPP